MTSYFVDTSALVKYYVAEMGSRWIQSIIDPAAGNVVVICELTPIEIFSTFERRAREKTVTFPNLLILQTAFITDYETKFLSVELEKPTLIQARNLVTKYPLRPPDAIQLACVIEARQTLNVPITFLCADNGLLSAAVTEGFAVDNPNLHP